MMAQRNFKFHDGERGTALAIRVKQSRGESCFSQVLKDGTVVVVLEQGKSEINTRLIHFVSDRLGVSKERIQLIAGEDGNNKLISIVDMKPKEIQKMILELIP
jgi:uncharacterized protein YggU (UPF0235/DUF167 family)